MSAELVAQHMAALAARTAASLVQEAKTNRELRNALELMKLDPNTVRIGKHDIQRHDTDDGPVFSIRKAVGGEVLFRDMVFYETCRDIVGMLNEGVVQTAIPITTQVRRNEQYRRLQFDIALYRDQITIYEERGQEDRLLLIENRLSDALARADLLRRQLTPRT